MRKYQSKRWIESHIATSLVLFFTALGIFIWLIYLSFTLPDSYRANHWNVAWVGFDVAMVVSLLITSWAIWKRRQLAIPGAMVTGTFLVIDSWFDVVTSDPGWDFKLSLLLAALSCSLAFFLFRLSRKVVRQTIRNSYSKAGRELKSESLWKTPLMMFEREDDKGAER